MSLLIEVFTKVGNEHSAKFTQVGLKDPDWSHWYAERLVPSLRKILSKEIEIEQLAAILINLDKEFREKALDIGWKAYYSQYFIDQG